MMKDYEFTVCLCGGYTNGTMILKAKSLADAYDKANERVGNRLYKAFPTLATMLNVLMNMKMRRRKMMKTCIKCGKDFDINKYGWCADQSRNICFDCKPPQYAKATKRFNPVDWDALDYAEGRCLRNDE